MLHLFESFEWRGSKGCSYSTARAPTELRFFGWSTARETSKRSCVARVLSRERRGGAHHLGAKPLGVSVALGHSGIKVMERHYSPWVRARQDQLEADVRRTWGGASREERSAKCAGKTREC